jgi:hypothetical protein
MDPKLSLFETVKKLHEAGTVKLSTSELNEISRQTADLINRSIRNKKAAKMPEGFEDILGQLSDSNPEEAYKVVLEFLKDKGIVKDTGEDKEMPGMDMGMDKPDMGMDMGKKPDMGMDKPMKDEMSGMDKDMDKEPKEDKPGKDKEDKDFPGKDLPGKDKGGFPGKGKEDGKGKGPFGGKGKGKDEEKGESKDHEESESPKEEKEEHEDKGGMEKEMPFGKGAQAEVEPDLKDEADEDNEKGKGRLKELQKKVEATPATTSVESMGMMEEKKGSYKVLITAERNIVAQQVGKGPLFHAIPSPEYKRNPTALKALANQIMGLLMYQGPKAAAAKCGAVLLAGVDDDVQTTGDMEIGKNTKSVTDDATTVDVEGVAAPATSTLDDPDNDTQEDPEKVNPTNREGMLSAYRASKGVAKYEVIKRADTSIDDPETVNAEKPEEPPKKVTEGAENETEEDPAEPKTDTTEGGEVDFQSVEASYRKLYSSRAKKATEEAINAFTDKFMSSIRIASSRMRLNQDAHPFKIAAADVLLSDEVEFTDGDKFCPMDARTASELIELIASEGHDAFVNHLLERSAALMEKDASYLKDVESDLKTLVPVSIDASGKTAGVRKNSSLRERAVDGSLSETRAPVPRPERNNKGIEIRNAFSGNKLGRRLSSLQG